MDTEAKTISAKVDGETYDNVTDASVCIYQPYGEDEPELMCRICLGDEEVGGLTKRTMISTANTKEAQALKLDKNAEIISSNNGIVIAKIRKSIGEIVAKVISLNKKK